MKNSIEIGDELTFACEIISPSGRILFSPGDKVIVDDVWKDNAKWSNIYDWWMPEKIHGVKLIGHDGWWLLNSFVETKR